MFLAWQCASPFSEDAKGNLREHGCTSSASVSQEMLLL